MELVGALLFVFLWCKYNSIDDFNIASRLFSKLRIWVPPLEADVDRIRKPVPKKEQSPAKAGGGGAGQATKRAGKGGGVAAGGGGGSGKVDVRGMAAADRVEALNLRQMLVAQGMLTRLPDFGTLDRIVLLLVLAWFMTLWQEAYRLAHPQAWLFRIGATFLSLASITTLAALLSLTWRRFLAPRTLAATTADFASTLVYSTGILSVVISSITLLLPPGYTTFALDTDVVQASSPRCVSFLHDLVGFTSLPSYLCPYTPPATRLLLVLTAALVAVAHVPCAWIASFAFVHRPRLPPRAQGNFLQHVALLWDPALACVLCLSYLRPLSQGLLARVLGVVVTDEQWLYMQGGLLALVIVGRLALVRWQLQTYAEYGGVLALYEELAKCARPDEISSIKIIRLFQHRIQVLPQMGLELFAPIAWLSLLLLLLLSKCFLPKLFGALAEAMMPQEAAEAFLDRSPKLNFTALQVLQQLRTEIDLPTAHATVHALWDFEWAAPEGWASLVGFFVWWSLGSYAALFVLSVEYRLVSQGGLQANV